MALLEWKKRTSNWYVETACGKYTVGKAIVNQTPVYTAWHNSTALLYTDSAEAAKARCQLHRDSGK